MKIRAGLYAVFMWGLAIVFAHAQVVVDSVADNVFDDTASSGASTGLWTLFLVLFLLFVSVASFYIFWKFKNSSTASPFGNITNNSPPEPKIVSEKTVETPSEPQNNPAMQQTADTMTHFEEINGKEAKIISDVDVHDLDEGKDGVFQNADSADYIPADYKKPKLKISVKDSEAKLIFE